MGRRHDETAKTWIALIYGPAEGRRLRRILVRVDRLQTFAGIFRIEGDLLSLSQTLYRGDVDPCGAVGRDVVPLGARSERTR